MKNKILISLAVMCVIILVVFISISLTNYIDYKDYSERELMLNYKIDSLQNVIILLDFRYNIDKIVAEYYSNRNSDSIRKYLKLKPSKFKLNY